MACGKAGNAIQFVQAHDGLSFRHAFELLRQGGKAVFAAQPLTKQSTVPRLPCPLDAEADDAALFAQVAAYYHQRLKETAARRGRYLASRGLDSDELIDRFQIGFADRTLGLAAARQEPERRRAVALAADTAWPVAGERARALQRLHCRSVPGRGGNRSVSFYGRRAQRGDLKHLYPPGPHRGLFNRRML